MSMRFRTEIEPLPGFRGAITHDSRIWTIGSCFADNIGDRLLADGFDVEVNPLGTLYNPLSILRSLRKVASGKDYTPGEFFEHEGKWRNYDFHSMFARRSAEESAEFINATLARLRAALPTLTTLILTFGSARCFVLKSTGRVVANCHKQHPDLFLTKDISLEECTAAIHGSIEAIRPFAPCLSNIILTVSPIRHKAYGLHSDNLSKSTLLLACDKAICGLAASSLTPEDALVSVSYFPSYEIMMDDLRDYRFYAADMVHPTEVAVDYIYDLFTRTFFTDATLRAAADRRRDFRRTLHRPSLTT